MKNIPEFTWEDMNDVSKEIDEKDIIYQDILIGERIPEIPIKSNSFIKYIEKNTNKAKKEGILREYYDGSIAIYSHANGSAIYIYSKNKKEIILVLGKEKQRISARSSIDELFMPNTFLLRVPSLRANEYYPSNTELP